MVNLVDVCGVDDIVGIHRIEELLSTLGVDFIYDCSIQSLKIRVRYSRFLAE
jgi:hypothetical protein